MKILTRQVDGVIICTLPNGAEIEVTMCVAVGEDHHVDVNAQQAVQLLSSISRYFEQFD